MKRLRCQIRGIVATLTMGAYWRSLLAGPLVVMSGHLWPEPDDPGRWSKPSPSPVPETWPGLVEFDESACIECGYRDEPQGWRRFYGSVSDRQGLA